MSKATDYIEASKREILGELQPTASQLERGLELFRSSIVVDTYSGGMHIHKVGHYSAAMKKRALELLEEEKDPEKKAGRIEEIRGEMIKWRALEYTNDPDTKSDHDAIWDASGVTVGIHGFGLGQVPRQPGGASFMDFIKLAARNNCMIDSSDRLERITHLHDVNRLKADSKHGLIWHTKEADIMFAGVEIEDPIENLNLFYGLGARMTQLSNSCKNMIGCSHAQAVDTGLTDLGREMVARMNELGIIIDLSHTGPQTILDTIRESRDPVIGTHFACLSVSPGGKSKYRNITDEALKALVDRGGMVGITLAPNLLGGFGFDQFFKHLDYAVRLIGAENVGIGTDESGMGYWSDPEEFKNHLKPESFLPDRKADGSLQVKDTERYWRYDHEPESMAWSNWPYFSAVGMVCRGYSDNVIRGIIGNNFLRFAGPMLDRRPRGKLI